MSAVTRKGKAVRPSWNYFHNIPSETPDAALLEMLESVRNAVEQVRDAVIGVREELYSIRHCLAVAKGLRDLGAIRRNTNKPKAAKS